MFTSLMKPFRGRNLSLTLFLMISAIQWQASTTEVLLAEWQTGEAAVSVNNLRSPDMVGDQIREILRDALYMLADTLVWGVPDILLGSTGLIWGVPDRLFKFITALDSQHSANDSSKSFRGSSKVNMSLPISSPALIQRRATHFRELRNVEESDDFAGVPKRAWLICFNFVALAAWLGSVWCILSIAKDPTEKQAYEDIRQDLQEDFERQAAMKRLMMNHMNEEDSARKHFMRSQQIEANAATQDTSTPNHHILVGSTASRSPSFFPGGRFPMSSGGLPLGQV